MSGVLAKKEKNKNIKKEEFGGVGYLRWVAG
jgi:hypothetical protein